MQDILIGYKHKLIKEIFIFDFFNNKNKSEIKIGFRFVFQSNDSTIKDHEVNKVMDNIIELSTSMDGVEIPGLDL